MRNAIRLTCFLGLIVVSLTGCGPRMGDVMGTAQYEGVLIEDGMVTFTPTQGKGSVVGAPIKAGNFTASGVVPGEYMIQVMAIRKVNFARSTEELAAMAAKDQAAGNTSGLVDPADIIPKNAVGNDQTTQVVAGPNKLDLKLSKPVGKGTDS